MRAVCETCAAVQPADWRPGDLCTSCGAIARRERRCHWCVAYTPDGRFCRSCGAETVDDELYAPARMLKAAGVDQFSVPARLASLDVDHVAHLTRLYQRQAAVVAHHVDDTAFVEHHLVGRGWAVELDDVLTAQLPMSDADLAELPVTTVADASDADRARRLAASSPIPRTRLLAALAVIRNGWITDAGAVDVAMRALGSADVRLADEAALAFGHWRALHLPMALVPRQTLMSALMDCTRRADAAIALRLLGEDDEVDPALAADPDADRAFSAALALGLAEQLGAALDDPQRRYPAALALANAANTEGLDRALHELEEDQADSVLGALRRHKRPFPELHDALWTCLRRSSRGSSSQALHLLVADGRADDAIPLMELDPNDSGAIQEVLQRMGLTSPDLTLVARWLVDHGRFRMSQYGVSSLAADHGLSDEFIPSVWDRAVDDEQRTELLRFAEEQLGARGDAALHRFVMRVVFGAGSTRLRAEAWWVLKRWYGQAEHGSNGPLMLSSGAIARFFDGVPDFLDRFVAVMSAPDLEDELTLLEELASLLRYSPGSGFTSMLEHEAAFARFADALAGMLVDDAVRLDLRSAAVRFFEQIASLAPTWTAWVLERFDARPAGLAYECESAAARIREHRVVLTEG